MNNQKVKITAVSHYFPTTKVKSLELEKRISDLSPGVKIVKGIIQAVTGVEERYFAQDDEYSSDMAARACKNLLEKSGISPLEIDLLIYASGSQDLIEPATGNIVQEKIGTKCPIFDIKNACNSFLNGLQVAEVLIQSGQYEKVLVAVGETPSKCIKFALKDREDLKMSFPGYTFGDGGAAVLLEGTQEEGGIFYRKFHTESKFWETGTLSSGGTMHPRGDEHSYFRGDGSLMKEAFLQLGPELVLEALKATSTMFADYKKIYIHQVSVPYLQIVLEQMGIPSEKVEITVSKVGNLVAASIPATLSQDIQKGEMEPGNKIMLIGLAGGISLGVLCYQF